MPSNGLITFRHGLAAIAVIWALSAMHKAAVHNSYLAGYADANAKNAEALAMALQAQQQTLQAEFTRQLNTANAANAAIRAEKAALAQREQDLKKEIDYVTTHYRAGPTAEPKPLPACIFTTGFVGVYNSAIGAKPDITATMPATGATQRTAAAASTTTAISAPDALQPSGVRQADILQHLTGYGARCLAIEAQLNGLIDYVEQEQRRNTDGT